MPDESHLDLKYFIDADIFNCPFCNRRHVSYSIRDHFSFNWTATKPCIAVVVRCDSCHMRSLHLSFENLTFLRSGMQHLWENTPADIDGVFFYSVPTSFFVMNENIPTVLRELFTEAEGCLKSNFLTGASACARKIVYELGKLQGAAGDHYDERVKSLKTKLPHVDPAYFDTLVTIQDVTSTKVHENALDNWEANHLRIILAALKEILDEIYVSPKIKEIRRAAVLDLKDKLMPKK